MQDLEQELHRLSQVEPDKKFREEAKARLMHKILIYKHETWFAKILKRIVPVDPSAEFIRIAKVRLMQRVSAFKQPLFGWLTFAKRITASVLVMAIAVTTTLLFAGGKQPVSAADNTYIQIVAGEVKIKHSDNLAWDTITKHTELSSGDLVQLSDSASAVIHFFDDTELRLAGNSVLLLSRLDISSGFDKQGIIETSLHKGQAWVQTLNVDDGYTQFSMITPDAVVSTFNSSFDVQTGLINPTTIRVFRNSVNVKALIKDTRKSFAEGKLNSFQRISIDSAKLNKPADKLANVAPITDLTDADRNEKWVSNNLNSDKNHLVQLRERELINLRAAAGVLPGEMLYPLKRAKERLSLAFSFDEKSQTNVQMDIANQRLNESIVLVEQCEYEKSKKVLAEYQNLMQKIVQENKSNTVNGAKLANRVLVAHQKTLIAALPGDANIGAVKQVLNQTEELLEEDPVKKAEIRLQNALEDLVVIQDHVSAGNLEVAEKELTEHKALAATLLTEVTKFKDDEQKKTFYSNILEAQYEERRILNEISRNLPAKDTNDQFTLLIKETDKNLDAGIKLTAVAVRPLIPDVALRKAVTLPVDEKVYEFASKVNIYKSLQGQKNQISRLLDQYPEYADDEEFLTKLSKKLDARAKDFIDQRILELKRKEVVQKDKEMRRKTEANLGV